MSINSNDCMHLFYIFWQILSHRQTSHISRTLVAIKIVDYSDVVGTSPVGAAQLHLHSRHNILDINKMMSLYTNLYRQNVP